MCPQNVLSVVLMIGMAKLSVNSTLSTVESEIELGSYDRGNIVILV